MVKIVDGICDMPDLCKNQHCVYFDISRRATQQYLNALWEMAALPGSESHTKHRVLEFNCPFLAWKDGQKKKSRKRVRTNE